MAPKTLPNPIVSTAWLEKHLDDPTVRVIEVRNKRENMEAEMPRVPGAVRFFWKDLCWHRTDRQFISPSDLAALLGPVGISHEHTIALFGEPIQYGTYAYWALTMAGHADVRIVDGSHKKWAAEGRPTSMEKPRHAPMNYVPGREDAATRVGREDVLAHLNNKDRLLLDVRTPEEYSGVRVIEYGQFDHGAERCGRIPGAKHFFFRSFLNEDDAFRSAEEIRAALGTAGIDLNRYGKIVCYCRLSHRATLAYVALTHIVGLDNIRIYDGSWTEWGSIVGMPVEFP